MSNPITWLRSGSFLLLLCMTAGCLRSLADYIVSRPLESDAYKYLGRGRVKLVAEGVEVHINPENGFEAASVIAIDLLPVGPSPTLKTDMPHDGYFSGVYYVKHNTAIKNPDFFFVEILVATDVNGVSFNPLQVYLTLEDGRVVSPSKYVGPVAGRRPGHFLQPPIINFESYEAWDKARDQAQSADRYFEFNAQETKSFALKYSIPPPEPGMPFSIDVKGLKAHGEVIKFPPVDYKTMDRYRG